MKIVIDTNIIIAAMIKDSMTRKIILSQKFIFITPDYTLEEIQKYKEHILEKAGMSDQDFEIILSIIFERVKIVNKEEYQNQIEVSKSILTDIKDAPFIALAISSKVDAIRTEDKHFLNQKKVNVFKTEDMIKLSGNNETFK